MDVAKLQVIIETKGAKEAAEQIAKMGGVAGKAETQTNALGTAMKALSAVAVATTILNITKEYIKMSDSYKLLEGRLGLVTKNTQELVTAQSELFKIAQNTRQSLTDTIDLYTRIARSTQQLGKSQKETLQVTDTINKSLVISGSSAESSRAALVQLGQGFASGTLRGDELNSVLEQTPRLAEAIAKGMGVTIGELRNLGAEGKLTGEAVFNALLKQGEAVQKEFVKMPLTVGQAIGNITSSMLNLVGTADKVTGSTTGLAQGFNYFAKSINENKVVIIEDLRDAYRALEVLGVGVVQSGAGLYQFFLGIPTALLLAVDASTQTIENLINSTIKASENGINKIKTAFGGDPISLGRVDINTNVSAGIKKHYDEMNRFLALTVQAQKKTFDEIMADTTKLTVAVAASTTKGVKEATKIQTEEQKNAQKKAEKLAQQWADRKREIAYNIAIAEQDELAKPYIILEQKYNEDLLKFKGNNEAKLMLANEYNANLQRLNAETSEKVAKQLEEEAKKSLELIAKEKREKEQSVANRLKILESEFKIRERSIGLLDDETDKSIALAYLNKERATAEIEAQNEIEKYSEGYYKMALENEEKLLKKSLEQYTVYGQIINGISGQMESSFMDFFDATNEGWMDFGHLAKSILKEVYLEAIKVALVKPLVGGLTNGAMGIMTEMFGGGVTPNAKGGVYNSPSLSQYTNQVVDKPTFFAFANGGVMGEAGSEAIMPLKRGSDGKLGVEASGANRGGSTYITIVNESGLPMDLKERSRSKDDKENETISYVMKAATTNPTFRAVMGLSK